MLDIVTTEHEIIRDRANDIASKIIDNIKPPQL